MADIEALLESYEPPKNVHREEYAYCPLCGGRFGDGWTEGTWFEDAKAITTVRKTASGGLELDRYHRFAYQTLAGDIRVEDMWRPIRTDFPSQLLVFDCTFDNANDFYIEKRNPDPKVGSLIPMVPMWVEKEEDWWKPEMAHRHRFGQGQLFFAIHSACYGLLQRFISSRQPLLEPASYAIMYETRLFEASRPIRSVIDLHTTLLARGDMHAWGGREEAINFQTEPHNYFWPRSLPFLCESPEGAMKTMTTMTETYPLEVVDTSLILSNLQLLPDEPSYGYPDSSEGSKASLAQLYMNLPTELRQQIEEKLFSSLDEAPLHYESFLPQSFWSDNLVDGRVFPWLWDLDKDAVESKEQELSPSQAWNWELLVRQLSQHDILKAVDIPLRLPWGLRNRRRIWRLLELARVGDLARRDWDKLMAKHKVWKKEKYCDWLSDHWGVGHEECRNEFCDAHLYNPAFGPEVVCRNPTMPIQLEPPSE